MSKLIPPKYEKIEGYLRDIQCDVVIPWSTVHDEVDYLTDKYLRGCINKKLTNISSVKRIMDKLGFPYISFLFDVEFDEKGGTWSPKDKLDVYDYPNNYEEDMLREEFRELLSLGILSEVEDTEEEEEIYELNMEDVDEDMVDRIAELPDGKITLVIIDGGKSFKYDRKVDISNL